MKKAVSFRLSAEAARLLKERSARTGLSQTATIELLIRTAPRLAEPQRPALLLTELQRIAPDARRQPRRRQAAEVDNVPQVAARSAEEATTVATRTARTERPARSERDRPTRSQEELEASTERGIEELRRAQDNTGLGRLSAAMRNASDAMRSWVGWGNENSPFNSDVLSNSPSVSLSPSMSLSPSASPSPSASASASPSEGPEDEDDIG